MEMLKKRYYFSTILFLSAILFSCNTPNVKQKDSVETETKDYAINKTDTLEVKSERPSDSIVKEDVNKNNFPFLVIENCAALWPMECSPSTYQQNDTILKKARSFMNNNALISIGTNGIQKQKLRSTFCMKGECGGSQVAIELSNKECFGVIASAKITEQLIGYSNMVKIDRDSLKNKIKIEANSYGDSLTQESKLFIDSTRNYLIQIKGKGYYQENDVPLYNAISWRIFRKIDNKWISSAWNLINFSTTNFPKPLSLLSFENEMKIIWYHGEGICCPSNSKAWVTQIKYSNLTTMKSHNYPESKGGLGQPCD